MTLSQWQRNIVAMATGMKLKGKMTYECKVRALVRNSPGEFGITVEANTASGAAREAAATVARMVYGDAGQPGFISEPVDGEYLASVGEHHFREGGLSTVGFTIAIKVEHHA